VHWALNSNNNQISLDFINGFKVVQKVIVRNEINFLNDLIEKQKTNITAYGGHLVCGVNLRRRDFVPPSLFIVKSRNLRNGRPTGGSRSHYPKLMAKAVKTENIVLKS
jgi:hypothetical protein